MIEKNLVVKNKFGLHAKPAHDLVTQAARFKSRVTIGRDGVEVNAKSILGLLQLAAESGAVLRVKADGPDEAAALAAIERLFASKFNED